MVEHNPEMTIQKGLTRALNYYVKAQELSADLQAKNLQCTNMTNFPAVPI